MGIELINLSSETKAYLNNLRRAIEKQTDAIAKSNRARIIRFVELRSINGFIYLRADQISAISDDGGQVSVYLNGDSEGFRVRENYMEVVNLVHEAYSKGGGE